MNPQKAKSVANARILLRQSDIGVLSTHSKASEGYPFGSVSTFMSTPEGDVVFYISDLAQHTKNINNNPKMCFTVMAADGDTEQDPNAGARLSLLGEAAKLDQQQSEEIAERFFTLYPDSRKYQNTHDFAFYKLTTERARFIGGFGDIHWVSKNDWHVATPEWLDDEHNMIKHMNEDHADAMQLICQHCASISAAGVEMLALSPEGAFYSCDKAKPLFIAFDEPAHTSVDVRKALVAQTNAAREALGHKKAS